MLDSRNRMPVSRPEAGGSSGATSACGSGWPVEHVLCLKRWVAGWGRRWAGGTQWQGFHTVFAEMRPKPHNTKKVTQVDTRLEGVVGSDSQEERGWKLLAQQQEKALSSLWSAFKKWVLCHDSQGMRMNCIESDIRASWASTEHWYQEEVMGISGWRFIFTLDRSTELPVRPAVTRGL